MICTKQLGSDTASSFEYIYYDAPKPWVDFGRNQMGGPWWERPLQTGDWANLPVPITWFDGNPVDFPAHVHCVPPHGGDIWPMVLPTHVNVSIHFVPDGGSSYSASGVLTYIPGVRYFGTVSWIGSSPLAGLDYVSIQPFGIGDAWIETLAFPPRPVYGSEAETLCPPALRALQLKPTHTPAGSGRPFGATLSGLITW